MTNTHELIRLLDLEEIEQNHYRATSPNEGWQRVYGGQVLGQALVAASRTVPQDRQAHSLHGYFLRAGDTTVPILYKVDRIRDGQSFTTRRVVAIQHGRPIFNMSISFQVAEEGMSHQFDMPEAPAPEDAARRADAARAVAGRIPAVPHGRLEPRAADRSQADRPGQHLQARQAPAAADVLDALPRPAARRSAPAPVRARLSVGLVAARYGHPAPRRELHAAERADGEPGSRHVVPPAVPRRRLAAVRAGQPERERRTRAQPRARLHPRPACWSPRRPRKA
jgi:hypothetical protein